MKVEIVKAPVDSRKYNVKTSEDFSLEYPLVYVRFEDFNWIWIPRYSDVLKLVKMLLDGYKNTEWFRTNLEKILKDTRKL